MTSHYTYCGRVNWRRVEDDENYKIFKCLLKEVKLRIMVGFDSTNFGENRSEQDIILGKLYNYASQGREVVVAYADSNKVVPPPGKLTLRNSDGANKSGFYVGETPISATEIVSVSLLEKTVQGDVQ